MSQVQWDPGAQKLTHLRLIDAAQGQGTLRDSRNLNAPERSIGRRLGGKANTASGQSTWLDFCPEIRFPGSRSFNLGVAI